MYLILIKVFKTWEILFKTIQRVYILIISIIYQQKYPLRGWRHFSVIKNICYCCRSLLSCQTPRQKDVYFLYLQLQGNHYHVILSLRILTHTEHIQTHTRTWIKIRYILQKMGILFWVSRSQFYGLVCLILHEE